MGSRTITKVMIVSGFLLFSAGLVNLTNRYWLEYVPMQLGFYLMFIAVGRQFDVLDRLDDMHDQMEEE